MKLKNGNIIYSNNSIEHSSWPVGKPVRGELKLIFILNSITESKTEMKNLFCVKLKGSIPKMVYGKVSNDMYKTYKDIREELYKENN